MKTRISDCGDPYQNLALAIVMQGVEDWRDAAEYLRTHPHVRRLDKILKKQKRIREKEERRRKREGLPREKPEPTPEERLLEKIDLRTARKKECERFFCGQWFEGLTDLDGPGLLRRLKQEISEKGGGKVAGRSKGAGPARPKAKTSGG